MRPDSALLHHLRRLNALRLERIHSAEGEQLEVAIEHRFGASCRLVVYGTLAPGEINAGQLAGLEGGWEHATVRGMRYPDGWGAVTGYPAFRWDEALEEIPVQLFVSKQLPAHWARLDRFEGRMYTRILVPVYQDPEWTIGNVYEARVS